MVALGSGMLVIGGTTRASDGADTQPEGIALPRYLRDGAVYDPAAASWRPIPNAPLCVDQATTVGGLVFAGGTNCSQRAGQPAFASYEPASGTWTTLPAPGWTLASLMTYDGAAVAVGIGGQLAAYSPASGHWLPMTPAPAPRAFVLSYASDGQTLVAVAGSGNPGSRNAVYRFQGGSWHRLAQFRDDARFGLEDNRVVLSEGTVIWRQERSLVWLSLATGHHHALQVWGLSGSIGDPATTVPMPIGAGRFVFWGGRDGAVLPETTHLLSAGALLSVSR